MSKDIKSKWIVITSINKPTKTVEVVSCLCKNNPDWGAIVVGDKKTPPSWEYEAVEFLSLEQQHDEFGELAKLLPIGHYARKNLGYLYAIEQGAEIILETDDDNIPDDNTFGHNLDRMVSGKTPTINGAFSWVNIYSYFSSELIWPRGLPLDEIHNVPSLSEETISLDCPIQQYLADGDPDVDAIYRLLFPKDIFFRSESPICLPKGAWVPFNSQNTLFYKEVFPLLYLPSFVSFRMTDIWRSFVAQAALWACSKNLAFKAPTVKQIRNPHKLMDDFADEVVGYLDNKKIANILMETLESLSQTETKSYPVVCRKLWNSLSEANVIEGREIKLIDLWLKHFETA